MSDKRSRILDCGSPNGRDDLAEQMRREGDIGVKLHDVISNLTMQALAQTSNKVIGIVVALQGCAASVHTLGHLVANKKGPQGVDAPLTPTQTLFAALLSYHAAPFEDEFGHSISEYSPLIVANALTDFEKLTGRRPDEELDEQMCRVCRGFASDPKNVTKMAAVRAEALKKSDAPRVVH